MPKSEDINIVVGEMTAKGVDVEGVNAGPLPGVISDAVEKFFKKQSGYALKKASDKPQSGFKVTGNVKSMEKKMKGSDELIVCWVSLAVSELPKDMLVPGKLEGFGGTDIQKLQKDAEFAVMTATQEALPFVVKQIKKATK